VTVAADWNDQYPVPSIASVTSHYVASLTKAIDASNSHTRKKSKGRVFI